MQTIRMYDHWRFISCINWWWIGFHCCFLFSILLLLLVLHSMQKCSSYINRLSNLLVSVAQSSPPFSYSYMWLPTAGRHICFAVFTFHSPMQMALREKNNWLFVCLFDIFLIIALIDWSNGSTILNFCLPLKGGKIRLGRFIVAN